MNDPAATPNEKEICARLIKSYEASDRKGDSPDFGEEYNWREDMYRNLHEMWTMRTGEQIHITDMDAGHLINTIFYIRRTINDDELLQEIPIYANMIKEAEKRGFAGVIYAGQEKSTNVLPSKKGEKNA